MNVAPMKIKAQTDEDRGRVLCRQAARQRRRRPLNDLLRTFVENGHREAGRPVASVLDIRPAIAAHVMRQLDDHVRDNAPKCMEVRGP